MEEGDACVAPTAAAPVPICVDISTAIGFPEVGLSGEHSHRRGTDELNLWLDSLETLTGEHVTCHIPKAGNVGCRGDPRVALLECP